jgi:hypothetical protein
MDTGKGGEHLGIGISTSRHTDSYVDRPFHHLLQPLPFMEAVEKKRPRLQV